MHNWKKEILSIPNLLSLFRLLLIPVYTTLFLRAKEASDYWLAAGVMAVSCFTDLVDGRIARKFNMITRLGIILDPFADKATQFTILVCLALRNRQLWLVIALFVVKESFMLTMGIINYRKGKMLPGALMSGKICTTVLFMSMILMVLCPKLPDGVVNGLIVLCVAAMLVSFADYGRAYLGKERKVQDID